MSRHDDVPGCLKLKPEDLTDDSLTRTMIEIRVAKTRARSASDWALIRDCESLLAYARLQAAKQSVAHLNKDWNPQRGGS